MSMAYQCPLHWRRSTACANGECVEVAYWEDLILVRSSRKPGTVVSFSRPQWRAFVAGMAISVTSDVNQRVTSGTDDTDAMGVNPC